MSERRTEAAPRGGLWRLLLAALLAMAALITGGFGLASMRGGDECPAREGAPAMATGYSWEPSLWPPGSTCIFHSDTGTVVVEPPLSGSMLVLGGLALAGGSFVQLLRATRRLDRRRGSGMPAALSIAASTFAILLSLLWAALFAVPFAAVGAALALQRRTRAGGVLGVLCMTLAAIAVALTLYGLISPPWLRGMVRR